MKALEFESQISPDNTLPIPPFLTEELKKGQKVRVLLLIPDSTEDADWNRMTAEHFLKGYMDCDAIYDQLSGR